MSEQIRLITVSEFLMGRATLETLSAELVSNMHGTVQAANAVLLDFGEYRKVDSGYRRPIDNAAAGGSKHSAHMTCEAVDLEDKDGRLKAFLTEEMLEKYDLYREADSATPSWCHVQTRPTRSGHRIFQP
jgi:hypothetical protein